MNGVSIRSEQEFSEFVRAVRKRPAMYLGVLAHEAIVRMVRAVLLAGLDHSEVHYFGPVEVNIKRTGAFDMLFSGLSSTLLAPAELGHLLDSKSPIRSGNWQIAEVAALSKEFSIESSNGTLKAALAIGGAGDVHLRQSRTGGKAFLRVVFEPLRKPGPTKRREDFYQIAGNLRDVSRLRPGLATSLRTEHAVGGMAYFYEKGLQSFLFEEDYARHPLHPGCLRFHGLTKQMEVEGCLRFVHAGLGSVRNWVNFRPTQGGSHLEGLGAALKDLFPETAQGCRSVRFITNPDTGAGVDLPHPFIGALHLRAEHARYLGPTKDILAGDDIREFVHRVASAQLAKQWRGHERAEKRKMIDAYEKTLRLQEKHLRRFTLK